jgi:hypothetical protein
MYHCVPRRVSLTYDALAGAASTALRLPWYVDSVVACAASQVSALSSQLYEAQVVSEKRLAAAAAQAQAAIRAERLELQVRVRWHAALWVVC